MPIMSTKSIIDSERKNNMAVPNKHLPTWREMNMDTSPEAEAVLFALWRETPGWRKLEMMAQLNKMARQLALAGLKRRHPDASPEELRRRLADLLLGPELAEKVYGPLIESMEKPHE